MSDNIRQICTFYVDDLFLGVDVRKVQEVLRYQAMTPVPLAPPTVRGLINLRGDIVTALDLRMCFGLSPRDQSSLPMNVVIMGDQGATSLLVDRIGDIYTASEQAFEPPPETLHGALRTLSSAVCRLGGTLMLLLDTNAVLRQSARNGGSRPDPARARP